MLTLGDGINQILNEVLIGTYRGHWNALNGAMDDHQTDITVKYPINGIGEGSVVAAEQELMYVVPGGVNESGKTLSLIRGFMGTTPTGHGDKLTIEINPRYPRVNVLNAMLEEVNSWPHDLFRTQALNTTLMGGCTSIDIDQLQNATGVSDAVGVLRVYRQKMGYDSGRWIPQSGWRYEVDLDQIGTDIEGSASLFLAFDESWDYRYGATRNIKILIARRFGIFPWQETTDPNAQLGIPISMHEIIKYGAAWRLVTGREGRRNFIEAEVESRKASEVPPQANAAFGQTLKRLRDARISEEIDRLRRRYPIRRSSG